jgi:hypothetical protein
MPDLDLIKQAEQGVRDGRSRFLRVKMANDTEFGLAAYFYSRNNGRIWRVAEGLEYGIVGINDGIVGINEGIISPKSPLARSRLSAA